MKEDSRKVLKSMMMVTQLGIVMMVPIFLCGALGVWLNRLTGIDIIFPILLVLGIGSGFRSVYMVTKSFYASDKKKENEKNIIFISSKNMLGEDGEATVDGIHFTDLGMMRYADLVCPIIKKAIK